MNTSKISGKACRQPHRIGVRTMQCAMLIGMLAASSWAVAARGAPVFNKGDSVDIAPWTPDIVTAIDEYVPSPSFSFGRFNLDHFAAANSLDQQGAVTAQLANGSIVVAGLVPDGVGGGFCGDGTKLCSIGLVNYNTIGQRLTWPSAGANGRFSNNYVVWPVAGAYPWGYRYIRDVSVRGNLIDVLVDWIDPTRPGLGRADVAIATFRDTGEFEGWNFIFGNSASGTESEDFYGAQMIQINSTTMIVAATTYDSYGPFISVTRLVTNNNQTPTKDATWGVPYNPAPNTFFANRLERYYPPSSLCAGPPCKATAGYVARQEGFATATDFYVTGSVEVNGTDFDAVTLKISSATGDLKSEFSNDGWARTSFDQPNSTLRDIGAGLYVYQDDVYIAAQVAQKCDDGIGMAKINGATGNLISAFGGAGKVVFGGLGNAPLCFLGNNNTVPFAISATGGRIGIAGYQATALVLGGTRIDPMLAVVNAVNGQVLDIDSHPVLRADGTRFGDALLYGIYGGPNATSPFTVSGNGRDTTAGNTLSYLTGRFVPVSSVRIFANGFD